MLSKHYFLQDVYRDKFHRILLKKNHDNYTKIPITTITSTSFCIVQVLHSISVKLYLL